MHCETFVNSTWWAPAQPQPNGPSAVVGWIDLFKLMGQQSSEMAAGGGLAAVSQQAC